MDATEAIKQLRPPSFLSKIDRSYVLRKRPVDLKINGPFLLLLVIAERRRLAD